MNRDGPSDRWGWALRGDRHAALTAPSIETSAASLLLAIGAEGAGLA
ncbi:hypothetical protein [Pendulispora rubella]